MTRVDEIFTQIRTLTPDERRELEDRLCAAEWDAWDQQIKDDHAAGKLDSILDVVRKDLHSGNTMPMP